MDPLVAAETFEVATDWAIGFTAGAVVGGAVLGSTLTRWVDARRSDQHVDPLTIFVLPWLAFAIVLLIAWGIASIFVG